VPNKTSNEQYIVICEGKNKCGVYELTNHAYICEGRFPFSTVQYIGLINKNVNSKGLIRKNFKCKGQMKVCLEVQN
jgi:hypothetical protein